MTKYLLIFWAIFFACLTLSVFAQQPDKAKAESVAYILQEADKYFKAKDYDKASNLYKSAFILDTAQYAANLYNGVFEFASGDKDVLASALARAVKVEKKHLVYSITAKAFQDMDSVSLALQYYDSALAANPKFADAYNNRGLAYEKLKNFERAEADYKIASSLDTNQAGYLLNLGRLLRLKKNNPAAIEAFTKSLSVNPKLVPAYIQRGDARAESGDFFRAIVDYSKALEVQPENSEAYLKRGVCEININMKPEGCADIKKAFDLGNSSAPTFFKKYCEGK